MDGRWGTVCNKSQEGVAEAVCSQLGFPRMITSAELHVYDISCDTHTQMPHQSAALVQGSCQSEAVQYKLEEI